MIVGAKKEIGAQLEPTSLGSSPTNSGIGWRDGRLCAFHRRPPKLPNGNKQGAHDRTYDETGDTE